MADVVCTWHCTSDEGVHINVKLQNLQYNAEYYEGFSLDLYRWNGSSWDFIAYKDYIAGEWYGQNWIQHEFINNEPFYYYSVVGWAKYGGTWYDFYSDNIYPEIPQASISYVSNAPHCITFSRTTSVGYLQTYIYDYRYTNAYQTLDYLSSNYGLSYSINGNNVTLNNWPPNAYVDVIVYTALKINGNYTQYWSQFYNYFQAGSLPTPSAPTLNHRLNVGFDLSWGYISSAGFYQCRFKTTGAYTESGYFYGNSNQHLWVDDQWGVSYLISVRSGYNAWDDWDYYSSWSGDNQATSAPKMCTIPSMNIGTNYVDFNFAGFSGGWTRVLIEWSTDYSYNNSWSVYNPNTSTTIVNLQQNTGYNFRISVIYTVNGVDIRTIVWDGSANEYITIYLTTSGRPSNWSWTTYIAQGAATYGVDFANKKIKIVTASEWNSFVSRINQFRVYKNLGSYSFTTVYSGDGLSAGIYNQARNAINDMAAYFTGGNSCPSNVSAGVKITAAHFTRLKDALNSIQ